MKKVISLMTCILALCLMSLTLTECTVPVNPQEGEVVTGKTVKPKIRLHFISSWGGSDTKAETLKTILDQFMEKNKDIEVVNESVFGDDFLPKLKIAFASGNDPDVFGLWDGSDIKALINAKKVQDLTDLLEGNPEWKDSFENKDMWTYTTQDDRIYGLPVEIIFEAMYINKDLFEKYKVQVPKNYEQLKKAIVEFKRHNIIPIAYNSSPEGSYIYQNIIAELGGKNGVKLPFRDMKIKDCYIKAMDYMKELYSMGAFPDNASFLSNNERNNKFKRKEAAMIVQGSWFIGEYKDSKGKMTEEGKNIEIIPFPSVGKKDGSSTLTYGLGCGTFYMSKKAWNDPEKKEASIELLKALTSEDSAFLLAQNTGMLSNVKIKNYTVKYDSLDKMGKDLVEKAKGSDTLTAIPDHVIDRTAWEEIIVKKFPKLLMGSEDSKKLWAEAIEYSIYKAVKKDENNKNDR